MNVREKILLELRMLDEGVVPITHHNKNVHDQLELMNPEESRQARRKWRKLKRKALKKLSLRKTFVCSISNKRPPRKYEKFAVIKMLARDQNT